MVFRLVAMLDSGEEDGLFWLRRRDVVLFNGQEMAAELKLESRSGIVRNVSSPISSILKQENVLQKLYEFMLRNCLGIEDHTCRFFLLLCAF